MTLYALALFFHIVGALGLFVALGLEWTSLVYLRRTATAEQAGDWLGVIRVNRVLGPASLATILVTGFYMMAATWGAVGWIIVALGAMVLLAAIGAGLTGARIGGVERAVAAEHGPVSDGLRQRLHDPLLRLGVQLRVAIGLGIVFLMTVKPDMVGALAAMTVAIALGLVSALPLLRRVHIKDTASPARS